MDKNELFERLEIAPMLDRTDAHFRRLVRLLNRRVTLYTEMIPAAALAHGARPERFLTRFDGESPVAMQLAGNDPKELAAAVKAALPFGFDEIDLNCGCPSTRVQAGSFGAYLMATPDIVRDCVDAMRDAAGRDIVTVKTRIALDDRTSGD